MLNNGHHSLLIVADNSGTRPASTRWPVRRRRYPPQPEDGSLLTQVRALAADSRHLMARHCPRLVDEHLGLRDYSRSC